MFGLGSIVPVAPGRMRNIWYHSKWAHYMTTAQLKSIPDLVVERDFTYGIEQATEAQVPGAVAPGNVQIELLSVREPPSAYDENTAKALQPQRASQLVDIIVPEYLVFHRRPVITSTESEKAPNAEPQTKSRFAASSAAEELAVASEVLRKPEATSIYGSVSTADMTASIKALMVMRGNSAETEEAARVVLDAEDVRIVQDEGTKTSGELDRIKRLGDFMIDIQVKGGEAVRRIVRVKAQD